LSFSEKHAKNVPKNQARRAKEAAKRAKQAEKEAKPGARLQTKARKLWLKKLAKEDKAETARLLRLGKDVFAYLGDQPECKGSSLKKGSSLITVCAEVLIDGVNHNLGRRGGSRPARAASLRGRARTLGVAESPTKVTRVWGDADALALLKRLGHHDCRFDRKRKRELVVRKNKAGELEVEMLVAKDAKNADEAGKDQEESAEGGNAKSRRGAKRKRESEEEEEEQEEEQEREKEAEEAEEALVVPEGAMNDDDGEEAGKEEEEEKTCDRSLCQRLVSTIRRSDAVYCSDACKNAVNNPQRDPAALRIDNAARYKRSKAAGKEHKRR
jgi:hypothetical protein